MKGRVKEYLNRHPHPNPPPSRGRELDETINTKRAEVILK